MFNIGGWEFLIILVVALIFLGPERLPGAARQAGKTLGALREMAQSFQNELQDAMNDPIETDARTAGAAAVEKSTDAKTKAARKSIGPGVKDTEPIGTGAAATAAHIAQTEPDRTHKPQSDSLSGTSDTVAGAAHTDETAEAVAVEGEAAVEVEAAAEGEAATTEVEDVVPDPAELNFASAAPRYPRAEASSDEGVAELAASDEVFGD